MSARDVMHPGSDDVIGQDAEERIARVREGLRTLGGRLESVEPDPEALSADERSILVTLVLSLDEILRDLERQTRPVDGEGTSTVEGQTAKWFKPKVPAAVASNGEHIDIEREYRGDLARRTAALRTELDERAGQILVLTGGGRVTARRRWSLLAFRGTGALATGAPPRPAQSPLTNLVAKLKDRRALMLSVGKALTAMGVVAVVFLLFEFGLTGALAGRDQRALLATFREQLPTGQLGLPDAAIPVGSPVAVLSIPRIHVDQVVVEGTTTQLLKHGPAHFRATPLPGEFGNAVLAGHRTTYGAPFRDLDQLQAGDTITATTGQGAFVYIVKLVYHIRPGQADVFAGSADSRLTLITADPAYAARGRLAVVAMLRGYPVAIDQRPPVPVGGNELGLSADPAGAVLALIWGQLLALAVWAMRRLYGRWNRAVTYLLATPVVLALALLTSENLDRLLPGTL